jgi:hypothetical protein
MGVVHEETARWLEPRLTRLKRRDGTVRRINDHLAASGIHQDQVAVTDAPKARANAGDAWHRLSSPRSSAAHRLLPD